MKRIGARAVNSARHPESKGLSTEEGFVVVHYTLWIMGEKVSLNRQQTVRILQRAKERGELLSRRLQRGTARYRIGFTPALRHAVLVTVEVDREFDITTETLARPS